MIFLLGMATVAALDLLVFGKSETAEITPETFNNAGRETRPLTYER